MLQPRVSDGDHLRSQGTAQAQLGSKLKLDLTLVKYQSQGAGASAKRKEEQRQATLQPQYSLSSRGPREYEQQRGQRKLKNGKFTEPAYTCEQTGARFRFGELGLKLVAASQVRN